MSSGPTTILDPFATSRNAIRELVDGATPAAGADFVQTIEGRYVTRLVSVFARLVTDANVANRELVLEYRDENDDRFALMGAPVVVTASDTVDYAFGRHLGQPDWPCDDTILVPLLPTPLLPSWDFRLHLVNAQATDQLSRVRILWERFYTDVIR